MKYYALLLILVLSVTIVVAQTDSVKTSTSVWNLKQSLGPITLGGGANYLQGIGVQIASTATSGVVSLQGNAAPFPINNVIPSWNVDLPDGTGALFELRAVNGNDTTAWYELGRIGVTPPTTTPVVKDDKGHVKVDMLMLNTTWPVIEFRVTLYKIPTSESPNLRLLALCFADTTTKIPYVEPPTPESAVSLSVPWRRQGEVPKIGGLICGPTSLAQAEDYLGVKLPTATVAEDCYDAQHEIYGNWPYICEAAAKRGFIAWVFRANSQQEIHEMLAQGYPVILSTAWDDGELTGAAVSKTHGHLMLCVGFTAEGDYIINDCAGRNARWDHIIYKKEEIAHAWLWHAGGVAIAIKPQQ